MRRLAAVVGPFLMAPVLLAQGQVVVGISGEAGSTVIQGGVVGGVAPGQTPTRDNAQPARPGTATLRGRVFAGDTGQPLRKAQVRINSTGPFAAGQQAENRLAITDATGRFEFRQLRAGRYSLQAQKGSYLTLQWGQRGPNDAGKPLEVLDGQTIERVDFSLPRGGVITGRVLDEFGDPAADVQVAAMRPQNMGGTRRLLPISRTVTTNDIGEFRLFAIPPGSYYLSATLRSNNFGGIDTDDRNGYAPTYYPGTADVASAQRLTLALGQTITDLSLSLLPIRTARVSGTALDSQGQPLRGTVMAQSNGAELFNTISGQIRPDGSFAISGLTPGNYTLQLLVQNGPNGNFGAADAEYASANVTVDGSDVSGIRLVPIKPSLIAGRIIIGAGDASTLRPSTLRIGAFPAPSLGPVLGPNAPPVAVNDDWTFQARGRAGLLRMSLMGLPPPWSIKSIRQRGTDVTDTGVDVKPGEDVSEVEVEITNRTTDLSGLVTNSRGDPVKDYWVVFFPRDAARRNPPSRYVRTGRANQDGRFKATGLPPGEYLAIALESIDVNEVTDPEFLDRLEARAARFALHEGETKTLDLKLGTPP
jgi:protocatechuate 3,4-dioxygenase beta subunit